MTESDDWQRLARHARDRRGDLDLTQEEVAAAGGLSTSTLRLIEGGRQAGYRPATLRDLERGLQWERGSARRVLDGGDPLPAGDDPTLPGVPPAPSAVTATAGGAADELARIQAETFAGEMFEAAEKLRREIARARREGVPEDRIFAGDESAQNLWSGTGTTLTPEDQRVLAIVWMRMVRPRRPPNSGTSPPVELAG